MTQPNIPMYLTKKSQELLVNYSRVCSSFTDEQWNIRERLRRADLAYAREKDLSSEGAKAKQSNAYGDPTKFQNITVPVILPQVESAVTYQASVFLTGNPIFGVVAAPKFLTEATQLETIIDNQAVRGGWVEEFTKVFRDAFKYNICAAEISWEKKVVPTFETNLNFQSGKQGKPVEVIWEGNCIKRMDLYNTFWDSRVDPLEIAEYGEFVGYTEPYSRIKLKQYIAALDTKIIENIIPAFESGLQGLSNDGVESYYIPEINQRIFVNRSPHSQTTNWLQWSELAGAKREIRYHDTYEVTTLYARILPSDFGIKVPQVNTPQVWKFVIVNHQVVLYAERQTNAHNRIPVLFAQPNSDGLNYQTKSLLDNVEPMQDITSAMWNSVIAARRRAISDRGIYDPSRIAEKHINSDNPSAKIPVKPSAYGKNIAESYFPIPFRDDQSGILMQETEQILRMADSISGRNPVRQGQFVKGNKTRKEFDTVMGNANGRDQLVAMILESQLFTPLKEIIKLNILQFQGSTSLYNRNEKKEIEIDPIALRKAVMEFKVSDGLLPSDKLISFDVLQVGFQTLSGSPQLAAGYNLPAMFSYLMKTQGADIAAFEKSPEQLAYEQAVSQWQQVVSQLYEKALKAGVDVNTIKNLPPQPLPEQFKYTPQGNNTQQQPTGFLPDANTST